MHRFCFYKILQSFINMMTFNIRKIQNDPTSSRTWEVMNWDKNTRKYSNPNPLYDI